MKTTNVDNTGIASMAVTIENEKGLQVTGATIIAQGDIIEFPLNFPTETKSHICEFDENEKIARRKYDGIIVKAHFSIMKQQRDTRVEQGRDVENIVSNSEFEKRKAEKEGKIEEYKASKKPAKVSGMEIGD